MNDRVLSRVVGDRLAAAADARRWYEVAERLRAEPFTEDDRQALRWHAVAFDYELVVLDGRAEGARETALQPKVLYEGGSSYPPPVATVPDEALGQWLLAVDVAVVPLQRARYRDLLWHRREGRAIDHALGALSAYLEIARSPDEYDGVMVVSAVSRAIELARAVRANDRLQDAVRTAIDACMHELDRDAPRPGIVIRLLAVVDSLPSTNHPDELVSLLERAEALYGRDPYLAKDLALMLMGHATNEEARATIAGRQVSRWESAHEGGLARLTDLRNAAQFAESNGLGDEARRLRRLAERMTPEDLDLQTVSGEISLPTTEIERLINSLVGDDDYVNGLRRLGGYGPPSGDPDRTEETVRQIAVDTPFLHMMPRTVLGPEGSILRVTTTMDEAVEVEIPRHEAVSISLTSFILADALDRLAARYGVPDETALCHALTTELVPEPAAKALAHGIQAYHRGDFDAAAHQLVPRIERVLRGVARSLGIAVTSPPAGDRPGGVRSLGELLHDLKGRWTEGWRRYFSNLLVDPFGLNLRNAISHGLLDEADRSTAAILIHAAVHLTLLETNEAPVSAEQEDPSSS